MLKGRGGRAEPKGGNTYMSKTTRLLNSYGFVIKQANRGYILKICGIWSPFHLFLIKILSLIKRPSSCLLYCLRVFPNIFGCCVCPTLEVWKIKILKDYKQNFHVLLVFRTLTIILKTRTICVLKFLNGFHLSYQFTQVLMVKYASLSKSVELQVTAKKFDPYANYSSAILILAWICVMGLIPTL